LRVFGIEPEYTESSIGKSFAISINDVDHINDMPTLVMLATSEAACSGYEWLKKSRIFTFYTDNEAAAQYLFGYLCSLPNMTVEGGDEDGL
jgi:hypothetical protein